MMLHINRTSQLNLIKKNKTPSKVLNNFSLKTPLKNGTNKVSKCLNINIFSKLLNVSKNQDILTKKKGYSLFSISLFLILF